MYPLHIVKDAAEINARAMRRFVEDFNEKVIEAINKFVRNDAAFSSVAFDTDIFAVLEKLRKEFPDGIPQEQYRRQLQTNRKQIDAFARAQFMRSIQGARASLNVNNRQVVNAAQGGPLPVVDMTRGDNLAAEKVDASVRDNVNLIENLSRTHANEVVEAVKDGILKGRTHKEIADAIQQKTGISIERAKFLAEDQVGNLISDITKERQTLAGFPGYIWRTMLDNRVRDKHEHLEGTYHAWNNPPMSGSSDRRLLCHPGEDYRCRCYAEPAWGSHAAERELNPDRTALHMARRAVPNPTELMQPLPLKKRIQGNILMTSSHQHPPAAIEAMTPQERQTLAGSALSAKWDQKNFLIHDGMDNLHDFSDVGKNSRDVSMDILRNGNYDRVFMYMLGKSKIPRVGFYSSQYNTFVSVATSGGKKRVVTCFKIDNPKKYLQKFPELK